MSVSIAPVTLADAVELIRANRESRTLHHPWVFPFIDREGFAAWFAKLAPQRNVSFIARSSEDRRIVGVINLNEIVMGIFCSAYLGYYAMSGMGGRGLMTKALRQVMHTAFSDLQLHRLEANIQPGNERSIALVKRLSFRLEGFSPRYLRIHGEWRDHQRWAITAEEFDRTV
jgi:[ribosomal protein S5]-alanine N-acetyltransferase